MNVVFVAPFGFAPKNTTARRVMPMARALARYGHAISVVVPPYDDPRSFGQRWMDAGVEVVCLPRPRVARLPGAGAALAQPALARMALRFIRERAPALVHVFKPKAVSGLVQYLLWRRAGRPRIVLDMDDWEGRAGWSAYEDYPRWLVEVFDRQERSGMLRCDAFTTASRTLHARARALRPDAPAVRIVNGFSTELYADWDVRRPASEARRQLGFSEKDRVILAYSRFFEYPVSDWSELIQHIAHGAADLRFLIVGAGKYRQERDLQLELSARGLTDRARFLGWLPFRDLGRVLASADLGLMPMADTLANRSKCSIKYLDLMHAGVPVLTTPVGEYCTYVTHGETGFVADDASPAAVARAALRALECERRPDIAARARARATGTLTWDKLTEPVHNLYVEVSARER